MEKLPRVTLCNFLVKRIKSRGPGGVASDLVLARIYKALGPTLHCKISTFPSTFLAPSTANLQLKEMPL